MKSMHNRVGLIFCLLALLGADSGWGATPSGTAFTYQGRLLDGGKPANGVYDLQFTLTDAVTGGSAKGGPIALDNVGVQAGLFSVELDFGASAYNGDGRWLDIGVRSGTSTGAYTPLLPRARVNPLPYAVHAATADVALTAPAPSPTGGVSQLVRSYPVAAGQSVAAGNIVTIDAGQIKKGFATSPLGQKVKFSPNPLSKYAIAPLSPTSFVIVYVETGSNQVLKAVVATLSGNSVALGAVATLATGTNPISAVAAAGLSPTQFAAAVSENTTSKGTAVAGTVAGGAITAGNPITFAATGAAELSMAALTATKVVIAFRDAANGDANTAIIGDLSGNQFNFGIKAAVQFFTTANPAVARLDDTTFITAFPAVNQSGMGRYAIGRVTGNAIAYDVNLGVFDGSQVGRVSVAALDSTHMVLVYNNTNQPYSGYSVALTINGSLTYQSTPQKFNGIPTFARVTALSPSRVLLAYADGSPGTLAFQPGTPGQDGVAWGAKITQPDSIDIGSHNVIALSPTTYAAAYSVANTGYVLVGHPGVTSLLGIARAAGTAGQSVAVTLTPRTPPRGLSDTHSGLIAGQYYYGQSDGTITPAESTTPLGPAISASEILLVDP